MSRVGNAQWKLGAVVLAVAAWLMASRDASAAEERPVDFVRDVQVIFKTHCYDCHGPSQQESGLRLNTRKAAFAGGDSGQAAIVPGKPEESRLLKLVRGDEPKHLMPPPDAGQRLSDAQIKTLTQWIAAGAEWPESADQQTERQTHWAWQPPVQAPLPEVKDASWPRQPWDRFVLQHLEAAGLAPSAEADRYVLARRVYLDLIGLPPTPEAVEAFVNDPAPDAYERLVDRLLADPAYGERWGRPWLDLARYADSKGYGSDPLRVIWRYRDWVIDAYNRNLPYDQFTIEQLAGDMLPEGGVDQILATAFHRNTMANDEGGTDDEEFRVAAIKDRVDTTFQVWMGLTFGCAKCHSHKYDPISQREYYQFFAYFNQSEDADRGDESPRLPTPTPEQVAAQARLSGLLAELRPALDRSTPELAAGQAAWEQATLAARAQWKTLPVVAVKAKGTTLSPQPDGAILASGDAPDSDTYEVELQPGEQPLTALRLEVLPHESLPAKGPGRSGSGNFVLNDFRVLIGGEEQQGRPGRFVRVEIPGDNRWLSLAEVQVMSGEKNLAREGKASQVSTDFEGPAELAIDGNTNGDYFAAKSTTHTQLGSNPWWEVDLQKQQPVERIVLWNRTDGGANARLVNFRVLLLDEARQPVWSKEIAEAPNPSVTFTLGGPVEASLAKATAGHSQPDFAIAQAIDGDVSAKSGWGVGPLLGQSHEAIFEFARPLAAAGQKVTVRLTHAFGTQHTLGRFRLSGTAAMPAAALPHEVSAAISVPREQRTPEQIAALARYYRSIAPELAPVREQIATAEKQLADLQKQIVTTPYLKELPTDKQRVTKMMIKGNFLTPGDVVEAALPEAFHPLPAAAPNNRLGVSQWLVSPQNPLTARVAVNRYWGHLFGIGLVETPEDFGTQGMSPSHPELLDWLAVEFRDGLRWDMKGLLRSLVTSATYRQSSTASPALLERDPNNRLLGRGPRHRIEAEMVRDQALALSGLLSRKQFGPSVYPPQPAGLWRAAFNGERNWATSVGEDRYRRGLYTFWRRTVPYPSMTAFDAPSREICTVKRISTNTPLQAFVTMNDPAYVEMAQALARRIISEGGSQPAERAAYGLRLCLLRPATANQTAQITALYQRALERYRGDAPAATALATDPLGPLPEGVDAAEAAAWTVVANVLLNLDGVMSKR